MVQLDGRYRETSLWLDGIEADLTQRPRLPGHTDCDVVIVGAGFTGLWTAYYLKTHDPSLDVRIVEREIAGYGASGRNGGTVGGGISGDPNIYARERDRESVKAAIQLSYRVVDEIGQVVEKEGIDCGWDKTGWLRVATTAAQRERIDRALERQREWGMGWELLEGGELEKLVRMPGQLAGLFMPHAARIDPARLARGLADAVERLGVTIYEGTEARSIKSGAVVTPFGIVKAPIVIRCTEGFTVQLPGEARRFLPLYSLMIATEPLPAEVWDEIGLQDCKIINDMAHLFFYGQRTMDDRLAIGGRGAPNRLGVPLSESYERNAGVYNRLKKTIARYFPAAADAKITHQWGGPLGVPRDWCQTAQFDRRTGLAWAGGYSGGGVLSAHVAGRVLTDLILERDTEFTRVPWIGHQSRLWEPEPLKYLARRLIMWALETSDRVEETSGHTARRMALVNPFLGGH